MIESPVCICALRVHVCVSFNKRRHYNSFVSKGSSSQKWLICHCHQARKRWGRWQWGGDMPSLLRMLIAQDDPHSCCAPNVNMDSPIHHRVPFCSTCPNTVMIQCLQLGPHHASSEQRSLNIRGQNWRGDRRYHEGATNSRFLGKEKGNRVEVLQGPLLYSNFSSHHKYVGFSIAKSSEPAFSLSPGSHKPQQQMHKVLRTSSLSIIDPKLQKSSVRTAG